MLDKLNKIKFHNDRFGGDINGAYKYKRNKIHSFFLYVEKSS